MEQTEKTKIISGSIILVTLGVLLLLHTSNTLLFDRSWPILIIAFSVSTLFQSPKDLGGWVIGAAGVLFLFFENWFGQIGETTLNVIRSILILVIAFFVYKTMKRSA